MADHSPQSDSNSTTGTPRWVKVFAAVVVVVILLVVLVMFVGGGSHGPGRHVPSGDSGGQPPPIEYSVQWA